MKIKCRVEWEHIWSKGGNKGETTNTKLKWHSKKFK